jgi:hypothetical protein
VARVELVRRAHGVQRGRGQSIRRHQRRHLFRLGSISDFTGSLPSTISPACSPSPPAARLASPQFMHPDQLRGNTRNLPCVRSRDHLPNPWPGGWWHLRDYRGAAKGSRRGPRSTWPRAIARRCCGTLT